jgi:hypothetical protein
LVKKASYKFSPKGKDIINRDNIPVQNENQKLNTPKGLNIREAEIAHIGIGIT